jgi:hypothetical protein
MAIMKIKINNIIIYCTVLIVFLLSNTIAEYSINGDQRHYIKIYENIIKFDILNAYLYYSINLSSLEIIHFILIYLANIIGISKIIFVSLLNAILSFVILNYLTRKNVYIFISILLVLSNFYILMLYFSAERLKVGMILFIISITYIKKEKIFIFISFLTVLAHAQFLLIYLSIITPKILSKVKRLILYQKTTLIFFITIIIGLILFFILEKHLLNKLNAYSSINSISDLFKIIIFAMPSIYYSKNKKDTIIIFMILTAFIMIIGGERLNIFTYMIFLYYALQHNRGLNIPIFLTSIYFLYKSINYISNIIDYGDGFYE